MKIFALHHIIGNSSGMRDEIKECEVFHHPELRISIAIPREEFAALLRSIKRSGEPQTVILRSEKENAA